MYRYRKRQVAEFLVEHDCKHGDKSGLSIHFISVIASLFTIAESYIKAL